MTAEQAQEVARLAGLWATSRVRRALVSHGCGALHETVDSTAERQKEANEDFHRCLRSLIQGEREPEEDPQQGLKP